jgi:hypothetical protein
MDDFRKQLAAAIEGVLADGVAPLFLVIDLVGAETLRRPNNTETLDRFRDTCMSSLSSAAGDAETFSYGEIRIVAILQGFDRLKTFALVEKMRRMLPLLAQSYDCPLAPEFDTIEFDQATGVSGLINQLVQPRRAPEAA